MLLKILGFISVTLFTLFLLWGLGWIWFATTIAFAVPPKEDVKTDAIVVLTGGNGRVNAGLNLLAKKAAPKLFISGVHKEVSRQDIYNSWTTPHQNNPCCIYLGYQAEDTSGNAIETKEWIEENDIKSLRLVTSSYHMPRALQEISKILPQTEIIPHPVFSDDFEAWKDRFWTLTFSEYNKTLVRWLGFNNLESQV